MLRIYLCGRMTLETDDILLRPKALQVYERCRRLISEKLGVNPSRETKALHAEVLRSL